VLTRARVVFAFFAWLGAACAEESTDEQTLPLPGDAETAAMSVLRHTLAYHSAVTAAYGRVQGELETNRYALVDAIDESRDAVEGDPARVTEELLEHMQSAVEDVKLVAEVYHLFRSYVDLVKDLRQYEVEPAPYDDYLWSSIEQRAAMDAIITSLSPENSERAYYLVPAYNMLAIMRLVLDASTTGDADDLRAEISDAIQVNEYAVSSGADDLGALSLYVSSRYSGNASAREKNDADPVVYSIRRMLAEQRAAL